MDWHHSKNLKTLNISWCDQLTGTDARMDFINRELIFGGFGMAD